PQPRYVFLMDAPIHDAPIKNALRSVHLYGVQLALPVRKALGPGISKAHLPTSAPLRAQPPPLVSDRFPMITAQEERRHHDHKSRCLSAIGIRFLSILFPPRNSAPLTIGLPTPKSRTRRGFHVPRTRDTTGEGALYTPRPPELARPACGLRSPLAATASGQVLSPGFSTRLPGLQITRRHQGFIRIRPSGLPLARSLPRTVRGPLGFFPELRTP